MGEMKLPSGQKIMLDVDVLILDDVAKFEE